MYSGKIMNWAWGTILLAIVGGCSNWPEAGPIPTEPESLMKVTIDSIPSGATVYTVNRDNTIGAKLGTTPVEVVVGFARQHLVSNTTGERMGTWRMYVWNLWPQEELAIWQPAGDTENLNLRIAVAKDGYETVAGVKVLYNNRNWPEPAKSVAFTVPLRSMSEAYAQMQAAAQQQQNITIQQKKDGLDTMNSGLDAIIKLGALRGIIGP